MHAALVAWIIWSRWGRFFVALARPLRVSAVTHEAEGITSVVLSGMHLRKAKAQGAVTKNGYEMLVFQAEKAWKIWNE